VVATCEKLSGRQIDISIDPYFKFNEVLSRALIAAGAKGINYSEDKVGYAQEFAEQLELADMSDQLKQHIEEIVNKIKLWNE
jgi:hypothetical protein